MAAFSSEIPASSEILTPDAKEEQDIKYNREDNKSTMEEEEKKVAKEEADEEEEEEEEEGECGFCLFMKGGGCKEPFVAWEKCVEEGEEKNENIAQKCFEITSALQECMMQHSEYYSPLLKAMDGSQSDQPDNADPSTETDNDADPSIETKNDANPSIETKNDADSAQETKGPVQETKGSAHKPDQVRESSDQVRDTKDKPEVSSSSDISL